MSRIRVNRYQKEKHAHFGEPVRIHSLESFAPRRKTNILFNSYTDFFDGDKKNIRTIVATLPDKGEKLRATNIVIDNLLAQLKPDGNFQAFPSTTAIQKPSGNNDIDDAPLTDAISKLTLQNKENGREHSVALANAQASNNQYVSSGMMRTRKPSIAEGSSNDTSNDPNTVSTHALIQVTYVEDVIKLLGIFAERSSTNDFIE
jgi:hypothetical protein